MIRIYKTFLLIFLLLSGISACTEPSRRKTANELAALEQKTENGQPQNQTTTANETDYEEAEEEDPELKRFKKFLLPGHEITLYAVGDLNKDSFEDVILVQGKAETEAEDLEYAEDYSEQPMPVKILLGQPGQYLKEVMQNNKLLDNTMLREIGNTVNFYTDSAGIIQIDYMYDAGSGQRSEITQIFKFDEKKKDWFLESISAHSHAKHFIPASEALSKEELAAWNRELKKKFPKDSVWYEDNKGMKMLFKSNERKKTWAAFPFQSTSFRIFWRKNKTNNPQKGRSLKKERL